MSENIQSISNGSFVLGQTSATNFQAGPGISITQPSEGTVRIANDETVLYSGSPTWKPNCSLIETPLNFERVRVLFGNNLDNTAITEKLYGSIEFMPMTSNNYIYLDGVLRGNSREWYAVSLWSGASGTSWGTVSGKLYALAGTESNTNNTFCSPYLILGINRKANA